MAQDIIDFGFDPEGLEATRKPVMDQLLETYRLMQKIDSTQIRIGVDNSWKELTASGKELAKTVELIQKATADLAAIKLKTTSVTKDDIAVTKQSTQANEANTASITRNKKAKETPEQRQAYVNSVPFTSNLAALKAEAEQAEVTGTVVNELNIAQAQAANSATVWGEAVAVEAAAQGELNVVMQEQTMTLKERIALEKLAAAEAKENADINEYLSNDYKQLSLAYNEASLKAKNYALALGETHPLTVQAAEDANAMGETLKRLDNSVGQNQRNVGNYAGSLQGAFSKLTNGTYLISTAISQATRMLIRFGVQMILFQVAFKLIELAGEKLVQAYENMQPAITGARIASDALNKVLTDGSGIYKTAVENVETLTVSVKSAKEGFIDKNEVVKQYNDTMGKTTGIVTNLDQVEQKLVTDAPAYLEMMLDKAAALQVISQATDNYVKTQERNQSKINELQDEINAPNAGEYVGRDFGGVGNLITKGEQAQKELDNINSTIALDQKKYLDQAQVFMDKAGKISNEHGFDMLGLAGAGGGKLKTATDILGELYKIALQKQIDFNTDAATNDKNNIDDRIAYLQKAYDLREQLLEANRDSELKINQEAEANTQTELSTAKPGTVAYKNLLTDLQDEKGKELTIEAKYQEDKVKLQMEADKAIEVLEEKRLVDQAELLDKMLTQDATVNKETADDTGKLLADRLAAHQRYILAEQALIAQKRETDLRKAGDDPTKQAQAQTDFSNANTNLSTTSKKDISSIALSDFNVNETEKDNALSTDKVTKTARAVFALNSEFNNGSISVEKYTKELQKIKDALDIEELTAKLAGLNAELLKVQSSTDLNSDDKEKKTTDLKKKIADTALQIAEAGHKSDIALEKITGEDKLKITQDTQDAIFSIIEDRYEKEKNLIQEQIDLLESQKDTAIAAVNASSLNAQQKADEIQTIELTAAAKKEALVKKQHDDDIKEAQFQKAASLLRIAEEIGIAIAGGNIAQAIEGGIELAVVAAKPIPKYALGAGVNGRPLAGGLSIFGEAGHELVEQPGKDPFVAYKATLMDLVPGTKITPMGNSMNDYLLNKSIAGLSVPDKVNERWLAGAIVDGVTSELQNVTRAIKKQRGPNVNIKISNDDYIRRAIRE